MTAVMDCKKEANYRFLASLIPELLHLCSSTAAKWFMSNGVNMYKNVKWNPKKRTTLSTNAKESAAIMTEDLWDLGEKWKILTAKGQPQQKYQNLPIPSCKDYLATNWLHHFKIPLDKKLTVMMKALM
jgi:hypothetical protein